MNYNDGKENISEIFYFIKPKVGTKVLLLSQTQVWFAPLEKKMTWEETYYKWKIDLVEASTEPKATC